MSNNNTYLVRKGKELRDTLREKRIQINPPSASRWMPPALTSEPFVVPRGDLIVPLDMDGSPLRARIKDHHDQVHVYPEFRIKGVEEDDGGRLLAETVYHHYEEQIPAIRARLDGIFRAHLGQIPEAERLEAIAHSSTPDSQPIRRRIAAELGLVVEWTLQPEPLTANWLQNLSASTPQSVTLTFNKELATTEFCLNFTITVEKPSLTHVHRVQRRAQQKLQPEEELKRLSKRIQEIISPAFRAIQVGATDWNSELIRELVADGFANVVGKRLIAEFGYVVICKDFDPVPNKAALGALAETAPQVEASENFKMKREFYMYLLKVRQDALKNTEGNFAEVASLDANIAIAKTEMDAARDERVQADQQQVHQLKSASGVTAEDLRRKFNDALLLEDNADSARRYGKPG